MSTHKNVPWDALEIGMEAEVTHLCNAEDFYVFANASGNLNPLHLPKEDGDADGQPEAVAPSMWMGALISGVLGTYLPGPGTLYKDQTLTFLSRAHAGDTITAKVRLASKEEGRLAHFDTWVEAEDGSRIAEGRATVIAPDKAVEVDLDDVPGLTVQTHRHFDHLLHLAEPLDPLITAVVAPEDDASLGGALLGYQHTLLTPILVGNAAKIKAVADEMGEDISHLELIDIPDHSAAAARAVQLVHEGRAQALMKGHLHTDDLLRHVVDKEKGLRTNRRLTHIFAMDVPGLDHLLMVTDAAINITPDLKTKVDIVQNAIYLAEALGIDQPKVGILCAVEVVNPRMPSTIDAAVLSKMSDRGQIKGGLVDGPLAMDNAVDLEAARTKGIRSAVAGHAQILVPPNLEAANMLAKELTFLAHAMAGGIVLGARCPIILTSRADDEQSRLASCVLAVMMREWKKTQP
ncbi:bifunctional enoyl-CoA hydratase/phosphate acetyltransferase [Actibacterium atlanticum]|uniref:Bifunctional enoyl-CoA hydratase/phosphate acetyltransferase n=1 Tax=Actibacterium atlanticum TaxID=1461693 RepID=A0A058ZI17_9RHOB|nr:bifunctional enoyl-CoA hydratase/phosphate acetyltransferase [Actibacterium atlanticum]KCV81244.1 bifunctional enoyl-CoA hydratase/phosphate acetyltransferase [Actibacterium atlanticum]